MDKFSKIQRYFTRLVKRLFESNKVTLQFKTNYEFFDYESIEKNIQNHKNWEVNNKNIEEIIDECTTKK